MKNRKEFEEYVRGLGEQKLARKKARRNRIRRVSAASGVCAAAVICAVLAVNISSVSDGSRDASHGIAAPADPSRGAECWLTEERDTAGLFGIDGSTDVPKNDSTKPANEYGSLEGGSDAEIQNHEGALIGTDKIEAPDFVNVYKGKSDADFQFDKAEQIDRLIEALESVEILKSAGAIGEGEWMILEFVYPDMTVTYSFTNNSVTVSGQGEFSVRPESVSALADLVDSLVRAEE